MTLAMSEIMEADGPMHYGAVQDGFRLGLSKPKPVYKLRQRIGIWLAMERLQDPRPGKPRGADAIRFVLPDGKVEEFPGDTRIDGVDPHERAGQSWGGDMSEKIADCVLTPGKYTMQWKMGKTASPAISFRVVP